MNSRNRKNGGGGAKTDNSRRGRTDYRALYGVGECVGEGKEGCAGYHEKLGNDGGGGDFG